MLITTYNWAVTSEGGGGRESERNKGGAGTEAVTFVETYFHWGVNPRQMKETAICLVHMFLSPIISPGAIMVTLRGP